MKHYEREVDRQGKYLDKASIDQKFYKKTEGQTYKQTDRQINRQTDGHVHTTNGWMCRYTDRQMDGETNQWTGTQKAR